MNRLLLTALFATTIASADNDPCATEPNDCDLYTVTTTVTVYASNPDTAAHHAAAYVTTGDAEIDGLKMSICVLPADTVELTACHESAFPFDEVSK